MSSPVVRFSDFLGIGYFGDKRQNVIAPLFDSRRGAEKAWERVIDGQRKFRAVFIEHQIRYEFIAYPLEMREASINYVIYRSFSSLGSLRKFKEIHGGRTFIKFGWHDLTKPEKFDVMASYVIVDRVEFINRRDIKTGTIIDRIRKNTL